MPTKKEHQDELALNNSLPTLHIDGVYLSRREDKMNLLRLAVSLPDMISEQARVMLDDEVLKLMIDKFSEAIDYYPEPPKSEKNSKRKKPANNTK
jgi:hypothetical protein